MASGILFLINNIMFKGQFSFNQTSRFKLWYNEKAIKTNCHLSIIKLLTKLRFQFKLVILISEEPFGNEKT